MGEKAGVKAVVASCFLAIVFGAAHANFRVKKTCPCGEHGDNNVILETPLSLEVICPKFKKCKSCDALLLQCLTCTPSKYGRLCEKDCSCSNGGSCAKNGTCICEKGFQGDKCEIAHQQKIYHHRRIRQESDSTAGCQVFPPPINGNIHLEASSPKVGDAIKYTCNENFTMMGSRTRHCNGDGKWSGEAPTCEKMCPFPPVTQNIKVKVNPYHLGAALHDTFGAEVLVELEFSCDSGYSLQGSPRVRCASGVWDQPIPVCRLTTGCDDPGVPENGFKSTATTSTNTYKPGNQIAYGCNQKHALVGSSKITCLPTGQWSSTVPTCIPDVIPTCVFTCKSPEMQAKLNQIDGVLVCNANGVQNLQEGSFVLTPEK